MSAQQRVLRRVTVFVVSVAAVLAAAHAAAAFPWGGHEWRPNEGTRFLVWLREHGSSGARFAREHPQLAATFNGRWPAEHRARLERARARGCQQASCARAVIRAVFPDGRPERVALAVAACETGGTFDPRAIGDGGDSIGLFQVNRVWWHLPWVGGPERLVNPWHNARVALRISGGGIVWEPWTCARLLGLS